MDADYGRILEHNGQRIDQGEWQNALFILTTVMSHTKADKAIVDAGLKAQSVDSGLPTVFGRDDVSYMKCSNQHGVVADQITLFDGTGVGLQDIAVAAKVVALARTQGLATEVEL